MGNGRDKEERTFIEFQPIVSVGFKIKKVANSKEIFKEFAVTYPKHIPISKVIGFLARGIDQTLHRITEMEDETAKSKIKVTSRMPNIIRPH